MDIEYWKTLSQSMPRMPRSHGKPPVLPDDTSIAAAEKQLRCKLPVGYIEFVKHFGPGELAWKYKIKAPGYPERGEFADLVTFHNTIQAQRKAAGSSRHLPNPSDADQLQAMVFFCETSNGEIIGWNRLEVENESQHEYGIYLWNRDLRLVKIADAFQDFGEDVCLSEENIKLPGWDEEECGPRRIFDPA